MPVLTVNSTAAAASNGTTHSRNAAPHRNNAAQRNRSNSPYQQRTNPRDNPTQQLIKQAVDYLIEQLKQRKSEMLTAYLSAMAQFHSYSFGNILQIARQKPDAQRVAGIRTWNELGRYVKKGEKGIQILAPVVGYRHASDGRISSPLFTARVTHLTVTGSLEHSFLKHSFTFVSTNSSQTLLYRLPLHSMLALCAASSIMLFSLALLACVEPTAVMPDPHFLPQ